MADPQKIKLRRGSKADVPTLDDGEPAVTLDTKEFLFGTPSGNANIVNRNQVYSPINYADKASGVPHFIQLSGSGTLTYDDSAPSAMGKGAFSITGNGIWIMDTIYATCPLAGIGGHGVIRHTSGSGVVSLGAEFYQDDGSTVVGDTARRRFIRNSVGTTSSYAFNKGYLVNEGGAGTEFPAGARWITPRIEIASNTGTILVDCFVIYPMSFAMLSLYA